MSGVSTGLGGSEHPQPGSLISTLAVSSRADPAALPFPQFPPRCSGQQLELCSWSAEKGQTTVRLVFVRKSCSLPAVLDCHPGLSISFRSGSLSLWHHNGL